MSAQFNDEPTLNDQLGRKGWVRWFGENMRNCQAPFVFSVHGDWGSGKTSFLHQLYHYLNGKSLCPNQGGGEPADEWGVNRDGWPPRVVVWFEAWRFQHDAAPVVQLLHEMRAQLAWHIKAQVEAKKLLEVTALSLLGFLDKLTSRVAEEVAVKADFGFGSVKKIGEQWEDEHFAVGSHSESLRKHFEEVIKQICTVDGVEGRVFVLVDDLDRCQADAAYKLLEGIKIYLNLPNCVFVLAIDHRQLERAIAQCLPGASKSGDTSAGLLQAGEYLEKICQDVWHLPLVPVPKQEALLRLCLEAPAEGPDRELNAVFSILTRYACLPANARKLKSYANTLRRFCEHCKALHDQPIERHAQLLTIMSCLYHFHPQIYRVLESYPAFYNEMLLWAEGQDSSNPAFEGIKLVSETSAKNTVKSPDPATGDFFRITRLVREVKDVLETEVKHYLLPHALL